MWLRYIRMGSRSISSSLLHISCLRWNRINYSYSNYYIYLQRQGVRFLPVSEIKQFFWIHEYFGRIGYWLQLTFRILKKYSPNSIVVSITISHLSLKNDSSGITGLSKNCFHFLCIWAHSILIKAMKITFLGEWIWMSVCWFNYCFNYPNRSISSNSAFILGNSRIVIMDCRENSSSLKHSVC